MASRLHLPLDALFTLLFWGGVGAALAFVTLICGIVFIAFLPAILWLWTDFSPDRCDAKLLECEERVLDAQMRGSIRTAVFDDHPDVRIRYLLYEGPSSAAVPIVCLHGVASSSLSFANMANKLAPLFTLYVVDVPGFGRSFVPDRFLLGGDPMEAMSEYLELFFDKLKLGAFVLVGHSMGGFIGINYMQRFPGRVQRFVLIDPVGVFPGVGVYGAYWGSFFKLYGPNLPVHFGRWGKIVASLLLADMHDWLLLSNSKAVGHRMLANHLQSGFWGGYWKDPKSDVVSGLDIPGAFVYGKNDSIIGAHQGQFAHDQWGCDLFLVPGKGHSPFDDARGSKDIGQFIADYVRKAPRRPRAVKSVRLRPDMHSMGFNPLRVQRGIQDMYEAASDSSLVVQRGPSVE